MTLQEYIKPRLFYLMGVALFGTLGLFAGAPQAKAQDILIGVSTPATGAAAIASERELWGINLAVDEINAAGGLLGGRKLKTMVVDNRCNPSEAVNTINKLIEAKPAAIIGAHCSSAALAAMPLIKEAKIPMVGGVASSPRITELSGVGGNEWTFRTNPSDAAMMEALVGYLNDKKLFKKIAVVAEDTDFGRGGANSFIELAKKAGLEIISVDFPPQSTPDFTSLLTRISRSRPDAIALFQLGGDQLNFLRTAMQMGLRIPYTGRAELGGENIQIIQAGGMENSVSTWSYSATIDSPTNKAFVAKVTEKHKMPPVLQTWAGYDNVRVIAQAITEASSADPVKVRDALTKVKFQTVMGPVVSFDRNNQAGKIVLVQQVKAKTITIADMLEMK
jgi:branched-chain amino acid transport system substrate-binding protein